MCVVNRGSIHRDPLNPQKYFHYKKDNMSKNFNSYKICVTISVYNITTLPYPATQSFPTYDTALYIPKISTYTHIYN